MVPKLLAPRSYETRPDLVRAVQQMTERVSPEGMIGALQALRDRPDSTPLLGQIHIPALVIHGADDQIIPVREAENTASLIPGAELIVIADAGHLPNLEQTSRFNLALREFIKNVYG
jgi:pimeloyl-ACP methyl ester carboxylesterase